MRGANRTGIQHDPLIKNAHRKCMLVDFKVTKVTVCARVRCALATTVEEH